MKYAVVFERADRNYSAYVPDLPGCIATAATLAEVKALIQEAIAFHLEGMASEGSTIPEAGTRCGYVAVDITKAANRSQRGRPRQISR